MSIFISIASYQDPLLVSTIFGAYNNATKKDELFEINLQFGIGNFHSVKINNLSDRAFYFNREEILKELEDSLSKKTFILIYQNKH